MTAGAACGEGERGREAGLTSLRERRYRLQAEKKEKKSERVDSF